MALSAPKIIPIAATQSCASCNSEKLASIVSARAHYTHCSRRLTKVKDGVSNVDNALGCSNRDNLGSAERNHEPIRSRQNSALMNSYMADCDVATECVGVPILSPTSSCVDVQFGSPTSPCVNIQIGSPTSSFRSTSSTKSSTSSNHANVMDAIPEEDVTEAAISLVEEADDAPGMNANCLSHEPCNYSEHAEKPSSISAIFTPEFAYETIVDSLKAKSLHPRYKAFLEKGMHLLRFQTDFNQDWLNEAAERYSSHLHCGKNTTSSPVSFARQLGLKIVKLRQGSKLIFNSIAFHTCGCPASWRGVLNKVKTEFINNWSYYEKVALNVPDANSSSEACFQYLHRDQALSNWLILYAASAVFTCDFVIYSNKCLRPKRIMCAGTASNVFTLWEDENGIFPCVRSLGITRSHARSLNEKRNKALYFNDTSRLANETFKGAQRKECSLNPNEVFQHYYALFQGPSDNPATTIYEEQICTNAIPLMTHNEVDDAIKGIKPSSASEEVMKAKEDKYKALSPIVAAEYKVDGFQVSTLGLAVGSR
ncbi:hypothetical protein ACOME3_010484 [Neoechinorhynchus agilis]